MNKIFFIFIIIIIIYIILFLKITNHQSKYVYYETNKFNELKYYSHDKWIVVTSINNPTKQIINLAKQNKFRLVVVADLKTNSSWFASNVSYFSIKQQNKFNLKSILSTPFNSYTRKNIGYLFAILNGAKFIYDTDDDNEPINDLIDFYDFNQFKYELEYDSNAPLVINPFAHFGQPTIWPRGFQLDQISNNIYNNYILVKKKTSIIQQGVVNGDPDVDAIFRLTKSRKNKLFDIKFDDSSPSVKIPMFKFTPFNSQNTLFHYDAFWSLYLPHTVSFRLCDIWRSYWSQRLMWLINGTLSYYGPNAYQLRNIHSYLNDFDQEKDMFIKTKDLIQFLYKWKCKFNKFYLCVIDLSEQMAFNNFWDLKEVDSIKNWLSDLNTINYKEPKIVNIETNNYDYTLVKYTPVLQTVLDIDNYYGDGKAKMNSLENIETFKYFQNYCSSVYKLKYNMSNLLKERKQKNITLLITFNFDAIYENIIFLKKFYQIHFKNIVFCGLNIFNISTQNSGFKKFDSYTFIEYQTNYGYFHYYCMSKLIDIGFKTEGILLMSDDVLLKYWNLDMLNTKKIWFFKNLTCEHALNSNKSEGIWMDAPEGRSALNASFNQLKEKNSKFKQIYDQFIKNLIKNSVENKKNEIKFCWMGGDVFYLPRNIFFKFNLIVKIFRKNNVFLEMAVPTILSGLSTGFNTDTINGIYFWTQYYNDDDYFKIVHFTHAFKLTHYKDPYKRKKMCNTFIQQKFNDEYTININ
jgi:hypothetical protein